MQAQTSRASSYNSNFALKGEDVGKVVELDINICHDYTMKTNAQR